MNDDHITYARSRKVLWKDIPVGALFRCAPDPLHFGIESNLPKCVFRKLEEKGGSTWVYPAPEFFDNGDPAKPGAFCSMSPAIFPTHLYIELADELPKELTLFSHLNSEGKVHFQSNNPISRGSIPPWPKNL